MAIFARILAIPAFISFLILLRLGYEKFQGELPDLEAKNILSWDAFFLFWGLFTAAYLLMFIFLKMGGASRKKTGFYKNKRSKEGFQGEAPPRGGAAQGQQEGRQEAAQELTIEISPKDIEPPQAAPERVIDIIDDKAGQSYSPQEPPNPAQENEPQTGGAQTDERAGGKRKNSSKKK